MKYVISGGCTTCEIPSIFCGHVRCHRINFARFAHNDYLRGSTASEYLNCEMKALGLGIVTSSSLVLLLLVNRVRKYNLYLQHALFDMSYFFGDNIMTSTPPPKRPPGSAHARTQVGYSLIRTRYDLVYDVVITAAPDMFDGFVRRHAVGFSHTCAILTCC